MKENRYDHVLFIAVFMSVSVSKTFDLDQGLPGPV